MRPLLTALALVLLGLLVVASPAAATWTWPLAGEVITQYRNGADPYAAGQHRGIDIAGAVGTPVVAAAAGRVLHAGTAGSAGLTVSVRTSQGLDTSYLHLSSAAVREGAAVAAGQRLGTVGITGRRSAQQPHLHFGVRESGRRHAYRDPLALLPPAPIPAPEKPLPAPAPVGAPAPVAPVPSPVRSPVPALSPRPIASPEPRRAPTGRRIPGGRRLPTRAPHAERTPAARREPTHGGARVPSPSPAFDPRPASVPDRAPDTERAGRTGAPSKTPSAASDALRAGPQLGPGKTGASALSPEPGRAAPRPSAPSQGSGPDIGWALACLGLLLAAGIIGLTNDGRESARKGAGRLSALLRPPDGERAVRASPRPTGRG